MVIVDWVEPGSTGTMTLANMHEAWADLELLASANRALAAALKATTVELLANLLEREGECTWLDGQSRVTVSQRLVRVEWTVGPQQGQALMATVEGVRAIAERVNRDHQPDGFKEETRLGDTMLAEAEIRGGLDVLGEWHRSGPCWRITASYTTPRREGA
ncbi:hypothetical protein [Streptomyces sp. CFMR 7]|uniref:hypothetical protein n=1 Tax=Streptomyces sp. CFMR 7 TaxID=1649184 RepID=UPI0011AB0886|nr:hypothetical protein [Streptomyces sp. CFMR 7]